MELKSKYYLYLANHLLEETQIVTLFMVINFKSYQQTVSSYKEKSLAMQIQI